MRSGGDRPPGRTHQTGRWPTFWDSFATHLLADGYDIITVQELLGQWNVRATMIYIPVLNRGRRGVCSLADV
ncbi:MAG: tyrosine-type recombinase/integrase [Pirellulales bacterium]